MIYEVTVNAKIYAEDDLDAKLTMAGHFLALANGTKPKTNISHESVVELNPIADDWQPLKYAKRTPEQAAAEGQLF